jgi:hypothetical protein
MNGVPMPDLIACPDPACNAIAEIVDSVVVGSTSGPIDTVRTRCLHKHVFVLPVDRLGGGATVARSDKTARPVDQRAWPRKRLSSEHPKLA